MNRKMINIALALAFTFAVSPVMTTYATTSSELNNKINQNKDKINSLENEKSQIQKEKGSIESDLEELQGKIAEKSAAVEEVQKKVDFYQKQIDDLQAEIDEANNIIKENEEEIKKTEEEIEELKIEEEEKRELLGERLNAIYKSNYTEDLLYIIITSEDFSDFLSRIAIVSKLISLDRNMIKEVEAIKEEMNDKVEAINEAIKELDEKSKEIEEKQDEIEEVQKPFLEEKNARQAILDELTALENEKESKLNNLSDQEKKLQQEIGELNVYNQKLRDEIQNMINGSNANTPVTPSSGGFIKPVSAPVTAEFGPRIHPVTGKRGMHTGIDLGAAAGTPIKAAKSGVVTAARYHTAYGNMVIIDHGGGIKTLYAHARSLNVREGQTVKQGDVVSFVGSTGYSTGPHLHFEIIVNGTAQNPRNYLSF